MRQGFGGIAARYLGLLAVAAFTVGPFLWLLATALRGPNENVFAFPPSLWPSDPTLANFQAVWASVPIGRYAFNSFLVAALAVVANVALASLAAFPLARMKFKGRDAIFDAILATMMVPFPVLMIPLFLLVSKLNMGALWLFPGAGHALDVAWLVLPTGVSAFGIFLMRQAFRAVPRELEEAVIVDGGGSWAIFWHVMLPMARPALATLAIFTFVGAWGDFLWPLIWLKDPERYTLPLGVARLAGTFSANWRLIAAGSVLAVLPILAFFLLMQRHFVGGAADGAVKG